MAGHGGRAIRAGGLGVFALVATLACRHDVDPPVGVDLVRVFPFTDAGQAASTIDLGSPEAARHVRAGWSAPETLAGGESAARILGRRASLQLAIPVPADGRLIVRCGLLGDGAPRATPLSVSLNGTRLGVMRIGREMAEHALKLPRRSERAGPNLLELVNPLMPEMPRSRRRQTARAITVDVIRLEGVNPDAGRPETHEEATPEIVLPSPSRVDFFVRVPRDGVLRFAASAPSTAALRVTAQEDGVGPATLASGTPAARGRLDLSRWSGKVVRLSFAAEGQGTVRLAAPALLGVPEDPRPPPAVAVPASVPATRRANVVIYLIDTLRADHLGCYGYGRPTSPNLDAFAAGSIVFTRAVAQASWTKPAAASVLTGTTPLTHGAVTLAAAIRPRVTMLAEMLRAEGYRTAAFVTNVNVRGELGFARGFDEYHYQPEDEARPTLHATADETVAEAERWLATKGDAPFFLYLHVSDPHAPYRPSAETAARLRDPGPLPDVAGEPDPLRAMIARPVLRTPQNVAYVESLYDGDVVGADVGLGRLLAALEARGLSADTLVVVTADHGEEFLDHGSFEHGHTLYRELLSVPLVVRAPGRPAARVDTLARQIDIVPTILRRLGLAVPTGVEGTALAPIVEDGTAPAQAFSATSLGTREALALTTADWKVVQGTRGPRAAPELYDLAHDPDEQHDVAATRPILLGYARQRLTEWAASAAPEGAIGAIAPIDAEAYERLKALGYLAR